MNNTAASMPHSLQVRTLSPYLAADVLNLDLAALVERGDLEAIADIQRALDAYIMIRLRGQRLTPAQMEQFGAHFGPFLSLKRPERPDAEHIPGIKFLKIISNAQTDDGRPLGDGSANAQ